MRRELYAALQSLQSPKSINTGNKFDEISLKFTPVVIRKRKYEPPRDKTNKLTCAPNEDSDQPGHLPSLIRVFAVRSVGS